jgi:hypothetical protein
MKKYGSQNARIEVATDATLYLRGTNSQVRRESFSS